MNIEQYFEGDFEEKKKVLFVDLNNLAHRLVFVAQSEFQESILDPNQEVNENDIWVIWKIYMTNSIFNFIKQFEPNKVIMAIDCKWNWRKKFYPEYKEDRKEKQEKSPIDFKKFYEVMASFNQELKENLPNIHWLQVDNCEADDLISILSRDVHNKDEVVIISTDRDFKQLLQYPHIKIYNPDSRVKDYMTSLNPKEELNQKIMIGDGSDNIDNVLVMGGYKGLGERTIGVGEKAASKILEEGLDSDYVIEKVYDKYNEYDKETKTYKEQISKEKIKELVKSNYQRNLKLISFEHIPVEIKNVIIESYKSQELKPINTKKVFNWVMSNEVRDIVDKFQIYSPCLKKLG